MVRSYEFIIDLLNRMDEAEPRALDPAGTKALREAKRVRRATIRRGGDEEAIAQVANTHFGMPLSGLSYSKQLDEPIYPPTPDTNN
jgi:hypothetical protein